MKKIRVRENLSLSAVYIILIITVIMTVFPVFWVISTSLKLPKDYFTSPPIWIPSDLTLEHYNNVFFGSYGAFPAIKNSLIVAILGSILTMVLSLPAAYSLSRYKIGGDKLTFWILTFRMLPPVIVILPIFVLYIKLGLLDTYIGLILPHLIFDIPFAVWLLLGFFSDIPIELHEASLVDGCNEILGFIKIIMPLVAPGIVVVYLFCFIGVWNDLLIVLSISRKNTATIMLKIADTVQSPTGTLFGPAAAMAVFAIVPIFILTLVLQKYLVRGLTLGGVKG